MDASGDPGEHQPGKNSRYYVLCGLACQPVVVQQLAAQFDTVIATHFTNVGIEPPKKLHYWELISNKKPYDKIDKNKLANDVFDLVQKNRFDLLGVCFDKVKCKRRPVVDHALEAMTMRFQTYLEKHNDLGMMIADREDENVQKSLQALFKRFKTSGTRFKKIKSILDGLYFAPSSNSPCLQVADFCAYAIRCSHERGANERLKQIEEKFNGSGGIRELP
ncbi:TPA: DUF3800 domain-containing protein [Candidatus Bathyarchaeota archaeon]|nr:DUF3800 domain-containing protein [Candidatus Bathyarchaeota archaeon]